MPTLASAGENASQVGRYLTVSNKPKPSQINLLSQIVQIRFPQNVQSIGDAMSYLLQFSGYSLVSDLRMSEALKTTVSKTLPVVDRELGPISLKDGLTTLAGPAFYLVQDPINREVDFRLQAAYQKIFLSHNKTSKRVSL